MSDSATLPAPTPLLLVTDIGRDIDDTVALLSISTYEREEGLVKLVGVVATGGVGESRARLARFWLRRLGYADEDVKVAACLAPGHEVSNICVFPAAKGVPGSLEEAAAYEGRSKDTAASDLIVELAEAHAGRLVVLVIAPLTPIARAMGSEEGKAALERGIAKLYFQAQTNVVFLEEGSGEGRARLEPNMAAFNLREDGEASAKVFERLQERVPFVLVGKYAAYRVQLEKSDFEEWDSAAGEALMLPQVEAWLSEFRGKNPEAFYSVYPVPEEKRGDEEWFRALRHVSHPYDPLLVLCALRPGLFSREVVPGAMGHVLVGGQAGADGGVPDPGVVRTELLRVFIGAAKRLSKAEGAFRLEKSDG